MNGNREYKDTVFTKLFSNPDSLLELYNALSGSNYDSNTKIEINTLEDVLFMDMMNDISFTVDDKLVVLIEHMSTISENLPLRLLLYISRVYEKIINRKAVYRQELMKIPTPELIVLYNGKSKYPNQKRLRLSDAFKEIPVHREKYGSLELTVRVVNINTGYNEHLTQKSKTLYGYVTFINEVRKDIDSGLKLSSALRNAVNYCESNQILQPFLQNHASEVENMLTTEFNMDDAIEVWLEEGHEKGLKKGLKRGLTKGRKEGRKDMAKKLKASALLSNTQIAEISGLSLAEIEKL